MHVWPQPWVINQGIITSLLCNCGTIEHHIIDYYFASSFFQAVTVNNLVSEIILSRSVFKSVQVS